MSLNETYRIQESLNKRDFLLAHTLLQEKTKAEPAQPDTHYLWGVYHYFKGNIGPAIQSLKKTLDLDPRHTDAAICLSVVLNDLGKYDEAKLIFEKANQSVVQRKEGIVTSIDLKFSIKHLELADLYFRYRRYDEAIEEYSKSILLNPRHDDLRIRRAKAYARKGFVTRALQDLQALKHEKPSFVPARIQLGLLHYSQGNLIDAELEWEAVMQISADHPEAKAYLEMSKNQRMKTQSSL